MTRKAILAGCILLLPLCLIALGQRQGEPLDEVSPQVAAQLYGGGCGSISHKAGCGTSSAKGCKITQGETLFGDGSWDVTANPPCGVTECGSVQNSDECDS